MTYARRNRLLLCIVAMVMVLSMVFFPIFSTVAYAAEKEVNYDSTNVLDDLNSGAVNGQPFDITDFPFNESKDIQVINFVEYCSNRIYNSDKMLSYPRSPESTPMAHVHTSHK